MRIRKQIPKLGSLQRWVRDCDAASSFDGSYGNEEALVVLDAILRTTLIDGTGEEDEGKGDGIESGGKKVEGGRVSIVKRMEEWKLRERSGENIYDEVVKGLVPIPEEKTILAAKFSLCTSCFLLSLPCSLTPHTYLSTNNTRTRSITT